MGVSQEIMSSDKNKPVGSREGSKKSFSSIPENCFHGNMYLHPNTELSSQGSVSSFTSEMLGMMELCSFIP